MQQILAPAILIVMLLPAGLASADEPEADLRPIVDRLAEPFVRDGEAVGLTVGVLTPDGKLTAGFGKLSAKRDERPDGDTLFEIGSITKVFTGLCLADMAEAGVVSLDDPIEKHLPPSVKFKEPPPRAITLRHLATHTSGLPRIPLALAFADPRDPYAKFNEERLVEMLNSYEWQPEAGTEFAYSNLGMGMLGWMLGRKCDTSYEQVVVERICDPLGMADTRMMLNEDQRRRLAAGHTASGEPVDNWHFDVLAGAGALLSTANDLLSFAEANLHPDREGLPPRLAKAIRLSQQAHGETDDSDTAVGLAWMIRQGNGERGRLVWHNGATGGYSCFLGLLPERGIAVVVLTNTTLTEDGNVADVLGLKLLKEVSRQSRAAGKESR